MYTLQYTFRGLSDILSQNQQRRLSEYLGESNISVHVEAVGAFEQLVTFTFNNEKPDEEDILSLGMLIGTVKCNHG